ncbi:hypothetical protein ACH4C6_21740 [Streptomyces sp. NPDC017943]|uniref:hypothetical protein n=1 Tax=Streptomyces sp. NPDC017943 TaxID=3365019 RepID=UPI0037A90725
MTSDEYVARFWQYKAKDREPFETLDEAVAFLAVGWERGRLSEIDILGPDGSVVLSGEALHARMMSALGA